MDSLYKLRKVIAVATFTFIATAAWLRLYIGEFDIIWLVLTMSFLCGVLLTIEAINIIFNKEKTKKQKAKAVKHHLLLMVLGPVIFLIFIYFIFNVALS